MNEIIKILVTNPADKDTAAEEMKNLIEAAQKKDYIRSGDTQMCMALDPKTGKWVFAFSQMVIYTPV